MGADVIFQSDKGGQQYEARLDLDSFMNGITKLCGTNAASVQDVVDLRKFLHMQNASTHATLDRILRKQAMAENIRAPASPGLKPASTASKRSMKRLKTEPNITSPFLAEDM